MKFKTLFFKVMEFFKAEPLLAAVLVLTVLVYGGFYLARLEKPKEPSKAMQQIQMVEKKLKEKEEAKVLKEFIFEKAGPVEIFLLVFVPLALFLALIAGVFLDTYLFGRLTQRKEIIEPLVPEVPPVPWGLGEITKSVVYILFAGIVISLGLGVFQGIFFGKSKAYENVFLITHTVLLDLFILGFIIYLVKRRWGQGLAALGLRVSKWGRDVWLGISGYVAALPIVLVVILGLVLICELISYEPPPHPLVEVFVEEDYKNPFLIGFSIFLACTIGPIIEEIFFRGFCYPAFKKVWGKTWAAILSAGFFALIHNSIFAFFPIFVLGIIFAYVYEKRGSLIPSIVMHVLHNSIFIGYFFLLKRAVLDRLV